MVVDGGRVNDRPGTSISPSGLPFSSDLDDHYHSESPTRSSSWSSMTEPDDQHGSNNPI